LDADRAPQLKAIYYASCNVMANIENEKSLTDIFGRFPSFHDAEIVSIFLEREGEGSPYLEAKIHLFESTNEVDSKGFYVLKNHTLVTFRFTCISLEYLKWFNHQNVLSHLDISEIEPEENDGCGFEVSMPSSYGCEALFKCRKILVAKVEPFRPEA
jgi:hypothetical protein